MYSHVPNTDSGFKMSRITDEIFRKLRGWRKKGAKDRRYMKPVDSLLRRVPGRLLINVTHHYYLGFEKSK